VNPVSSLFTLDSVSLPGERGSGQLVEPSASHYEKGENRIYTTKKKQKNLLLSVRIEPREFL
jgi:hypothetical protein